MKINAIRISGFRGIPPVDPPALNLAFPRVAGQPKDILIFGPNAYGKSSIADALGWFFKEEIRSKNAFEDYDETDNAHVLLGQPVYTTKQARKEFGDDVGELKYSDRAYIELDILHNGLIHTVRKEIDKTGRKQAEVLGEISSELLTCLDEVIILDHDQFRSFVAAANKEKWKTFSSLIGFEELDHFREGLNSAITSKSLTDFLEVSKLETELPRLKKDYQKKLKDTAARLGMQASQPVGMDEIKRTYRKLLEINLHSIQQKAPHLTQINARYWLEIRNTIRTPENLQEILASQGQLKLQLQNLLPFNQEIIFKSEILRHEITRLNEQKQHFDKSLLAQLYKTGLQVIQGRNSQVDVCPLCESRFDWDALSRHIQEKEQQLNFELIQGVSTKTRYEWERIKHEFLSRGHLDSDFVPPEIRGGYVKLRNKVDDVEQAISLESFDYFRSVDWLIEFEHFAAELREFYEILKHESGRDLEKSSSNPMLEVQQKFADLENQWKELQAIQDVEKEITTREKYLAVTDKVVKQMRSVSEHFRDELNDFSGQVAELISLDVQNYYHELHPDDDIKPYLATKLAGTQRIVELKCSFKKFKNKSAASMLSESHRNSLGMAVMLAFMKYKRKEGSPVEFIVFDDVTQSFDVGHRANLLNLLQNPRYPEICNSQFIFLTHDRTLADYITRSGDESSNWQRYDIEEWQLSDMRVMPSQDNLFERLEKHQRSQDLLATAIYGRHALEYVLKNIAIKAPLKMKYNTRPWTYKIPDFINALSDLLAIDWKQEITFAGKTYHKGIINPDFLKSAPFTRATRILNLTVHDSDFLENPPSIADLKSAIQVVYLVRDRFTCPTCREGGQYEYIKSFSREIQQAKPPKCDKCGMELPAD